jgi:hypothetical protein
MAPTSIEVMTMRQAVHHRPAPQGRPEGAPAAFPGKYLSLTSFRRDGTGVATPVWFVEADGRLLVETDAGSYDAGSYKVRRIRRDPWGGHRPLLRHRPAPRDAGAGLGRAAP